MKRKIGNLTVLALGLSIALPAAAVAHELDVDPSKDFRRPFIQSFHAPSLNCRLANQDGTLLNQDTIPESNTTRSVCEQDQMVRMCQRLGFEGVLNHVAEEVDYQQRSWNWAPYRQVVCYLHKRPARTAHR